MIWALFDSPVLVGLENEVNALRCFNFIFYGNVKLEIESIKNQYYRLIVKTEKHNQWKKKTSIFRGIIQDNIDEEKIYDIAVLGEIVFYNDFPQIKTATY